MTEKILKIADLVNEPGAPRWVGYPGLPGFELLLRLPDIPAVTRLVSRCSVVDTLPEPAPKKKPQKKGQTALRVNWLDYHDQLCRYAVENWRGFRAQDLALLLPGLTIKLEGGDPEAPLAFCPENLDFLLRHSGPFAKWLSDYLRQWEGQDEEQEEQENQNLSPTPTGSSTPTT